MISSAKLAELPPGPIGSICGCQFRPRTISNVSNVKVDTTLPHEFETDPDYSNQILHVWSDRPEAATVTFASIARVVRSMRSARSAAECVEAPVPSDRFLQPDRLGVIDDQIRSLAEQITPEKSDVMSKSRAIYDYVIDHMAYDKVTPGWGNGDTLESLYRRQGKLHRFQCAVYLAGPGQRDQGAF